MGRFGAISPPVPPQTPGAAAMAAKTFHLPRLPVDGYVLLIVLCAATAAVIPARGIVAEGLDQGINWVIALLFFLYGARLSPQAAWADRKSTRLNSSHYCAPRMPSSA